MGVSTDGRICFGYCFEDGYEFPWDTVGLDEWWLEVCGFKHSFNLYDATGEYIGGVKPSDEKITAYFKEKMDFQKANPIPIVEVNYCAGECPMYILAVPSSLVFCSRGDPTEIHPEKLTVTEEEKEILQHFCNDYKLKPLGNMKWYLTSYWG